MSSSIVLVTGANRGLGLGIVRALYTSTTKPYTLLLGSRDLSHGQNVAQSIQQDLKKGDKGSKIVPVQIDIEDQASVDALKDKVDKEYGRVDVLINNAGGTFDIAIASGRLTARQAFEKSLHLHVTSTHLFTEAFAPLLIKSPQPRLIFISSSLASLEYTFLPAPPMMVNASPGAGWPKGPTFSSIAYRSSKTAENMLAREWFRILKEDGVIGHIVCPGALDTDFWNEIKQVVGGNLAIPLEDPNEAGKFVQTVVQGEKDEHNGRFINAAGLLPW